MADPRDYKLDLSSLPKSSDASAEQTSRSQRPFLSVQFACCKVYQRIYRSPDGTCYDGRCPKCGKPVRFLVGPGGTDSRSFVID